MRRRLLCLLLAWLPVPAAAAENLLGMSYIETSNMRLIWFDPLGYLAPHAIRAFTNSVQWQRRMFGWTPSEPTTILFKDSSDYGTVAASASPRNRLFFVIGPLSRAFETYPGQRAHVLADEPRDGPRRDVRPRRGRGPLLAALLRHQGLAADGESGVAAVRLPHGATLPRPALVRRGQRRVPRRG